ncbi:MAG: type II toxin-antitoxin system RelE/ParE family toxin [Chloroflexota bacterium]
MAAVVWLPAAYDDLDDIRRYVTPDRPEAAGQIAVRIVQATRRLSVFPHSGRVVPELERSDIREVIVDRYRIVYSVSGDEFSSWRYDTARGA